MPAKKIMVTLGFMAIPLRTEAAIQDGVRTHTVCTGGGTHAATRVKSSVSCPECGVQHSSVFGFPERALDMGDDDLVVLDREALEAAKGIPRTGRAATPAHPQVAGVDLRFHTRESVYKHTLPDDSVQNVYPDRGGEKAYALLVDALEAQPELVGVMIWAPTARNALWVLEVFEGRLVATKRVWPEQVRKPSEIAPAETTEQERALFAQMVAISATDFEMTDYVDEASKGITELAAQGAPEVVPASTVQLEDLLKQIAAAGAKPVRAKAKQKAKVAA